MGLTLECEWGRKTEHESGLLNRTTLFGLRSRGNGFQPFTMIPLERWNVEPWVYFECIMDPGGRSLEAGSREPTNILRRGAVCSTGVEPTLVECYNGTQALKLANWHVDYSECM